MENSCHFLFCFAFLFFSFLFFSFLFFSFFLSFFLLIVFKLQKKYGRSEPGENLVKSPKSVKKRIVKESSKNRNGVEKQHSPRDGVVVGGCGWLWVGGGGRLEGDGKGKCPAGHG